MQALSSHDFEQVYKDLGINLDTLGCVMADIEPGPGMTGHGGASGLYYAKDKTRFWINGWVADKNPHVTLLYGLLKSGREYAEQISAVLDGWKMDEVEIEDIGYFDSPYEDEPYYCIIAHLKVTDQLLDAHTRLQFLPHINTFNQYRPHMTIAYINKDEEMRDRLLKTFNKLWAGKKLKVKPGISY